MSVTHVRRAVELIVTGHCWRQRPPPRDCGLATNFEGHARIAGTYRMKAADGTAATVADEGRGYRAREAGPAWRPGSLRAARRRPCCEVPPGGAQDSARHRSGRGRKSARAGCDLARP